MWYWPITKRFWKVGYRLFNAKFLYFLGGPKGVGQLKEDTASLGLKANSNIPAINFAVPSLTILQQFQINDFDIPKEIKTGVIYQILDALQTSGDKEYMMCADAKKVTAGVNKNGGDVDMFGHGAEPTLNDRKDGLQSDLQFVDEIQKHLVLLTLKLI